MFINAIVSSPNPMENYEEKLETYVIRKTTLISSKVLKTQQNTVVPQLVCDIVDTKTTNGDIFSTFGGNVKFRLCLLSGRIVGFVCTTKRCRTYLFDDGTACIQLSIFKENKNLKVNRSRRRITFYYRPHLVGSLREILQSAEKLSGAVKIEIGTALIVLGRLSIHHGKICIISQRLFSHKGANCDMEIAFKDYLIQCYRAEGDT